MTCESCGDKPKKCSKDFTRAVVEIDNPEQITLMRKVTIPASMGDDTTVPPVVGKYKNVLLYYEANSKTYLYSSDGIPTQLVNGVTDYEAAVNLPQINGHTLLGNKTATQLGLQDKLTAGDNISIDNNNVISAVDTTYGPATDDTIGLVKPGDGLNVEEDGTLNASLGKGVKFDASKNICLVKYAFDTVADMKASIDLDNGDYATTSGYYDVNDGGGSFYRIRTKLDTDTTDEMLLIAIGDSLVAELIVGDEINSKQCGLKGDGTTDEVTGLNSFFALSVNASKVLNNGVYVASSTVFIKGAWGDQTPYRQKVSFDKASIKYTGTANGCSIAIFNFQRGDIDGVNIAHSSNDNYIQILGCWFTNINGMECRDLKLSTDDTLVSSLGYATASIMNLNFNTLRIWKGTLTINSLNDSYINSVYFYNSTINATDESVCVDVTSQNATENITFNCSDLSYASDAVFKLSNTYPVRSTININSCYLDSNVPLFYNDNTENFLITAVGNYAGAGFNHLPLSYKDNSRLISFGSHTNNANFIGTENVNYAINGDMSSSNTLSNASSIMGQSGTYTTREYITTDLNVNNRGRRITWSIAPESGILYENITLMNLPRDGFYTAYIRMKVISGTFTSLQLRFSTNYYEVQRADLADGKEVLITYSAHNPISTSTQPSCYLQFNGVTEVGLQIEVYEVGVIYGTTLIPYPKLHELAKL